MVQELPVCLLSFGSSVLSNIEPPDPGIVSHFVIVNDFAMTLIVDKTHPWHPLGAVRLQPHTIYFDIAIDFDYNRFITKS